MTVRFMLDSNSLGDLDPAAQLLATYSDLVPDPARLRAKFPKSVVVLIDRGIGDPSGEASIFDIERGALTLESALVRYDAKSKAGVKYLTVYCNRSNLPAVDSAFGARPVFRWVATLDGTSHIAGIRAMHGPAAIQCLSASDLGIHADGSLVFESDWNPSLTDRAFAGVLSTVTTIGADVSSAAQRLSQLAASLRG